MKAKLLRKFRQRYEVRPSIKPGYHFVVFDHKHKLVEWCKTAYDVANLCALKLQGPYTAIEHQGRHTQRKRRLVYFKSK